jgi:hypothetical protein
MLEAALVTVVAGVGGGVELVALALEGQGSPRAVWSARQVLVDGVTLARGWDSLGDPDGMLARDRLPAVAANADGGHELVVTGGAVWHTWQGELRGDWSGWHSLERPRGPGRPSAGRHWHATRTAGWSCSPS